MKLTLPERMKRIGMDHKDAAEILKNHGITAGAAYAEITKALAPDKYPQQPRYSLVRNVLYKAVEEREKALLLELLQEYQGGAKL